MNLGTAGPHPEREGRAPPQGLAMRRNPPGLPADAFAAHECWLDGGRWGRVRALSFTPQGPATAQPPATVLHWHGGGFRLGKPEYVAAYAQALATACGVTVICPQYRLAPDHPFPAALNDVAAALAGVLAQNTGAPLILSGDSAGGGLAAGLALLFLREWLSFQELMGCLLLFGAMLVLWREEQRLKAAPQPRPATA